MDLILWPVFAAGCGLLVVWALARFTSGPVARWWVTGLFQPVSSSYSLMVVPGLGLSLLFGSLTPLVDDSTPDAVVLLLAPPLLGSAAMMVWGLLLLPIPRRLQPAWLLAKSTSATRRTAGGAASSSARHPRSG